MALSFKHKTSNGVTGFALESFLEFLTGEKPLKTTFENKNFTFYMKSALFENDKIKTIFERFEKFYFIKIKNINELN